MAECLKREQIHHVLLLVIALTGCIAPAAALTWSWDPVALDSGYTYWSSIALDSSENPHIAYTRYSNGDLMHAWMDNSGTWSKEIVDSEGYTGFYPSLKISPINDIPLVSYHDDTNSKLKYAEKNPSTGWWTGVLDPESSAGHWTSLATDSSGRPHICYDDASSGLKYATWYESAWHYTLVAAEGTEGSIALTPAGKPGISYWGSDQHLKYATINCYQLPSPPYPTICLFVSETVDSTAYIRPETSLAIDTNGNPHIGYYDTYNHQLKYAVEGASGWQVTVIDSSITFGYNGVSLALDSSGNPSIAYTDGTNGLKFAWKDGTGWHTMAADPGVTVQMPSLALDSAGNAHISYFAADADGSDHLKYARGIRIEPIPFPGYSSRPTDPDGDGIYEDLNANGRLDFADVVLYFQHLQWIAANEPIAAFDLNGNSRIDFADIVALFNEI